MSENKITTIPGVRPTVQKEAVETQPVRRPKNQYVMVKNYVGGLSVGIDPHDFSMPTRKFNFEHNVDRIYIPAKFALGVFVTPSALKILEEGYITFEGMKDLIQEAEDLGYYVPESVKNPKVTHKEIRALLRAGDVNKMKTILLNATKKTEQDFIDIAKQLYSNLSMNVVHFLEKEYKVSLKPIDLNA